MKIPAVNYLYVFQGIHMFRVILTVVVAGVCIIHAKSLHYPQCVSRVYKFC